MDYIYSAAPTLFEVLCHIYAGHLPRERAADVTKSPDFGVPAILDVRAKIAYLTQF